MSGEHSFTHPFLTFPVEEKLLKALAENERDFILLHGACLRLRESCSNDEVRFAPFFLFPSLFPEKGFRTALLAQPVMNKLISNVSHCRQFLTECLQNTIKVDDFTAHLFNIYTSVMDEGPAQTASLGLLRCDYFHDLPSRSVKQVELNTIASSFGGVSHVVNDCHRYALTEVGQRDKLDQLPVNTSLEGIASGMIHAWDKYNVQGAVILFVVEGRTINICDQRFHEFQIYRQRPGIKVIRRSHGQLTEQATLDQERRLIVDGHEVALVYYRTGYSPNDYPTERVWEVRLLIERSRAIKSPSIHFHLAGTKKVQQELARPGVLERFLSDPAEIELCRSVFTGLYSLDMGEEGDAAVAMALANPDRFVLKPQREGGGNNLYGSDIATKLTEVQNSAERTAYILMDRIRPHVQQNYLLRPGQPQPELVEAVGELGVFGYILSDFDQLYCNEGCGFTLRSKPASVQEGGIIAGFGAMDSPYLVYEEETMDSAGELRHSDPVLDKHVPIGNGQLKALD